MESLIDKKNIRIGTNKCHFSNAHLTDNSHNDSNGENFQSKDPLEHTLHHLRQFIESNNLSELVQGKNAYGIIQVLSMCMVISTPSTSRSDHEQHILEEAAKVKCSSMSCQFPCWPTSKIPSSHSTSASSFPASTVSSESSTVNPVITQDYHGTLSAGLWNHHDRSKSHYLETSGDESLNNNVILNIDYSDNRFGHNEPDNNDKQIKCLSISTVEDFSFINDQENEHPDYETSGGGSGESVLNHKPELGRSLTSSKEIDMVNGEKETSVYNEYSGNSYHDINGSSGNDKSIEFHGSSNQEDHEDLDEETLIGDSSNEPSAEDHFLFDEDHEDTHEGYEVWKDGSSSELDWENISLPSYTCKSDQNWSSSAYESCEKSPVHLIDKQVNMQVTKQEEGTSDNNINPRATEILPFSPRTNSPLNEMGELDEISSSKQEVKKLGGQISLSCPRKLRNRGLLGKARGVTNGPPASLRIPLLWPSSGRKTLGSRKKSALGNSDTSKTTESFLRKHCYYFLIHGTCQHDNCHYEHQVPQIDGLNHQSLLDFINDASYHKFWYLFACALKALIELLKTDLGLSGYDLWSSVLCMLLSKNISHLTALNHILNYMTSKGDITSVDFLFNSILQHNILAQSKPFLQRIAKIPGIQFPAALMLRSLSQLKQSHSKEECLNMFEIIKCIIRPTNIFSGFKSSFLLHCAKRLDFFEMSEEANYIRCNALQHYDSYLDPDFSILNPSCIKNASALQYSFSKNKSRYLDLEVGTLSGSNRNASLSQQKLPERSFPNLTEFLEKKRKLAAPNGRQNCRMQPSLVEQLKNLKIENNCATPVPQEINTDIYSQMSGTIQPQNLISENEFNQYMDVECLEMYTNSRNWRKRSSTFTTPIPTQKRRILSI